MEIIPSNFKKIIYIHTDTHTHTHIYVAYMPIYIYIYIYTHKYIYIYIGKEAKALLPLSFKLINLESCPLPS